jgi:hypothetical protein
LKFTDHGDLSNIYLQHPEDFPILEQQKNNARVYSKLILANLKLNISPYWSNNKTMPEFI